MMDRIYSRRSRLLSGADCRLYAMALSGSGEGGCLRRGQLRRINAERDFCRRLHAVCALSEVDEIQVHVQNLVFRVLLFQLQREVNFLQLAGNRLLTGQVGELNQLLGNGGCTLTERAVADVGEHSADDARDVKARMLVEAQIDPSRLTSLAQTGAIHDKNGDYVTSLVGKENRTVIDTSRSFFMLATPPIFLFPSCPENEKNLHGNIFHHSIERRLGNFADAAARRRGLGVSGVFRGGLAVA